MLRKDFEEKTFEEVMEQLNRERDSIMTLDNLKAIAKDSIDKGDYYLASHILEGLEDGNNEPWWDYNVNMRTMDNPIPMLTKDDVELYISD